MATLRFIDDRIAALRIINSATFVNVGDVTEPTTAIVSDAKVKRNNKPQVNVSFRKLTVLDETLFNRILNRLTKDKVAKTRPRSEKLEVLTTEQLAAVLQLCRVGSYMCNDDSKEAGYSGDVCKFKIGVANRTSTVVGTENDSITAECCEILELPVREVSVACITGIQKTELVSTRNIERTVTDRFADWGDDDDDFNEDENEPEIYTAEMLNGLSNDKLKAVMIAYPTSVVKKADGKTDKAATITALIGQPVIA